jgi:hypothetical protein
MKNDFKPQFIMWEEGSWRADRIVAAMTRHQRAMYRNLLMECYVGNERPYLTTNDRALWQIAEADSLEDWLQNKPAIMVKFREMVRKEDREIVFCNKKVIEVWNDLEEKLDQKRNAGRASAKSRRLAAEEKKQYNNNNNRALSTPQHPLDSVERISTTVERPLKSTVVAETPLSKQLIGNEEENGGPHNDFQQPTKKEESKGSGSARPKTDVEIMGEFREAYNSCGPQVPFAPTKKHQSAAIEFYKRYGQAVAIAAWTAFLLHEDPGVVSKGKKEPRAHRLNDFCATGACETYATRVASLLNDPTKAREFQDKLRSAKAAVN